MSDSNPNERGNPQTPRDSLVLLTAEERAAEERRQSEAADKKAEEARKERGLTTAEKANELARSNRNLMIAVVILTAVTAGATWYQGWKTSKNVDLARETLEQIRADSQHSSDQFQAQIHHFDAGLGVTQMLAQHAGEQSISAGKTAYAAQGSLGVAQRTLDVSNRPWIDPTITQKSGLTFGPNGARVNVAFQLRNVGHTPAIHTLYHASIVYLPQKAWHMVEVKKAERQECNSFPRHFFAGSPTLVPTIFPGQDPPQIPDWPATITASEIQAALTVRGKVPGPPGEVELILVACVSYQGSFQARIRHSAYGFALGIPESGGDMAYIIPKGTYDNVRLVYLDSFAD